MRSFFKINTPKLATAFLLMAIPLVATASGAATSANSESGTPMWVGAIAAIAAIFVVLTLKKRQNG